jgi:hypothetical protein
MHQYTGHMHVHARTNQLVTCINIIQAPTNYPLANKDQSATDHHPRTTNYLLPSDVVHSEPKLKQHFVQLLEPVFVLKTLLFNDQAHTNMDMDATFPTLLR